jgi:hypothetical protein
MGYCRAQHVAWRKVGDETVLVDLQRNRIFGLNQSGGTLWAALDECGGAVSSAPGAPGEAVRAFLLELAAAGLVDEVVGPRAATPVTQPPTLPEDAPPMIAWQEELETFAAACATIPGHPLCNPQPTSG